MFCFTAHLHFSVVYGISDKKVRHLLEPTQLYAMVKKY
jgi:hypothetical protein